MGAEDPGQSETRGSGAGAGQELKTGTLQSFPGGDAHILDREPREGSVSPGHITAGCQPELSLSRSHSCSWAGGYVIGFTCKGGAGLETYDKGWSTDFDGQWTLWGVDPQSNRLIN